MRKENKGVVIEQLTSYLNEYPHFYLANLEGMDAAKTANLRRLCNKADVKLVVVKNTLLRRAMSEANLDLAPLYGSLKGNTAIMFTHVANAPAKLIKDLTKDKKVDNKIRLKGAYAETGFYGEDQLETLVAIKSKEELIGEVISLLQSPIRNVVSALQNKDEVSEEAAG
ncbi:MAG: 50S ribosomal protein L10 [Porphyromonadaceae bacterium]|nr:50S ribosomal protein L10 [Porphyromonadaceae bacterium]